MERRHFLKVAIGVAAGAAALAASAQAAPLMPHPLTDDPRLPPGGPDIRPAVTTADEVDHLKPEEIRWGGHWHHHGGGHHRHWGWHHRHWGWRRRHWGWHHRHWGWRHRRWHRRHWW